MNRSPYAAVVLTGEVAELFPGVGYTPEEKDGLGVYRSLVFYGDGVDELDAILDVAIQVDKRIVALEYSHDELHVHFTATGAAEDRAPFNLAAAKTILDAAEKPKPKKRTAKKSAAHKAGEKVTPVEGKGDVQNLRAPVEGVVQGEDNT